MSTQKSEPETPVRRVERYRCLGCGQEFSSTEFLRAPSPFDPSTELLGCPYCRGIDGFALLCDEPGCRRDATCGFPTREGYRRTCGAHRQWSEEVGRGGTAQ
jgi:DNA-directed RNA polymerase subunit RPC12/RpoP